MKAEVVTVSSYTPKQPYYRFNSFKESVRKFGVEPTILGYNEEWHGLMTKPRRYREFLRKGHNTGDVLLVVDAWDIVFQKHPQEVADEYRKFGSNTPNGFLPDIIFNAERNCFPCTEETKAGFDQIADAIPVSTPWRYLNSGFMAGTPAAILKLLESMSLDAIPDDYQKPDGSWFNPNDQAEFQSAFLKQPVPMQLDYDTRLCLAAHGSVLDELDFNGPCIVNKITGVVPGVFHCNGDAKNHIAPTLLKHLGLPER